MKIAMLTTTGERCGIAAYTRALIAGLETIPEVEVVVVPITEGKQPREHYVAQAEILNAAGIDIVHIQHEHSFWGGILPGKSAYWDMRYLLDKPVVLTAHTTYSLAQLLRIKTERRPHKWLVKTILNHKQSYRDSVDIAPFTTAMTLVHTSAARDELIARGAVPSYVHIVPTGIPTALPSPTDGDAFREKYGLSGRRLVTLFGYIAPNKGYELSMQIIKSLPDDVTFVIAGGARTPGEEPYAQQIKSEIDRQGLSKRVVITGFLEDVEVAEAMEASKIVVAPHTQATGSYSVTLPITHGRPILASDMDCFKEIADRVNCIELFKAGDVADYRTKMLALLSDPVRLKDLSQEARKYAERFSWPKVAQRTHRIYGETIEIYKRGHHPSWTGTPHAHFK